MKLRCSRNDSNDLPCVRCARANAACTTGSAKPLNRSLGIHASADPKTWQYAIDLQEVPPFDDQELFITDDCDEVMENISSESVEPSSITTDWLIDDGNDGIIATHVAGEEADVLLTSLDNELPLDFGQLQGDGFSSLPNLGNRSYLQQAEYFGDDRAAMDNFTSESVFPHMENVDITARIYHLNTKLLLSSSALHKERQENSLVDVMSIESKHNTSKSRRSFSDNKEASGVHQVLSNMFEFLAIIQQCVQDRESAGNEDLNAREFQPQSASSIWCGILPFMCSDFSGSSQSSTRVSPLSTSSSSSYCPLPTPTPSAAEDKALDITTILALLSCYLHLIIVIDAMLRGLRSSIREIPSASISMVPELHFAGFLIQDTGLQLKMLTQVIEHQLETIETVLGLPTEYRVTTSGSPHFPLPEHGLLSGRDVNLLLRIVMRHGEQNDGQIAPGIGIGTISSLRESIKGINR